MDRKECLAKAIECVTGQREQDYGTPEDNFGRIASLWTVHLHGRSTITAVDVAAMLALLKIARIGTTPTHEDSWVDLAGYAACGAEVAAGSEAVPPTEPKEPGVFFTLRGKRVYAHLIADNMECETCSHNATGSTICSACLMLPDHSTYHTPKEEPKQEDTSCDNCGNGPFLSEACREKPCYLLTPQGGPLSNWKPKEELDRGCDNCRHWVVVVGAHPSFCKRADSGFSCRAGELSEWEPKEVS